MTRFGARIFERRQQEMLDCDVFVPTRAGGDEDIMQPEFEFFADHGRRLATAKIAAGVDRLRAVLFANRAVGGHLGRRLVAQPVGNAEIALRRRAAGSSCPIVVFCLAHPARTGSTGRICSDAACLGTSRSDDKSRRNLHL